MFFLTILLI